MDSYKDIYDKLNTEDAKNLLIENLYSIFEWYNNEFRDNSYISYLTSNSSSFKSIINACKDQDDQYDQEIPFNLFNPNILWEELTNVQSEISREHYKEILNTLDKDFITKQLNKSSISLTSFKKLLENYKDSFSSKINIETLQNDKMKSLIQIPKKKTLKRNSDKRKYKKNSLIKYINQHSKFDNIDKNVINQYSLDDLLSTKDSINNKELYLDILNMKKRTVRSASNINKIEKVITELKSELLDTSWV